MSAGMGPGLVRPPPPEYKAAQAQLMHAGIGGMGQQRFAGAGPMRRVAQQPMPPSGKYRLPALADSDMIQIIEFFYNSSNIICDFLFFFVILENVFQLVSVYISIGKESV